MRRGEYNTISSFERDRETTFMLLLLQFMVKIFLLLSISYCVYFTK